MTTKARLILWALAADGAELRCHYCSVTLCTCGQKGCLREITSDHVVSKALGGSTTADNVVPACWLCNHLKGDMDADLFLRYRTGEITRRVALAMSAERRDHRQGVLDERAARHAVWLAAQLRKEETRRVRVERGLRVTYRHFSFAELAPPEQVEALRAAFPESGQELA